MHIKFKKKKTCFVCKEFIIQSGASELKENSIRGQGVPSYLPFPGSLPQLMSNLYFLSVSSPPVCDGQHGSLRPEDAVLCDSGSAVSPCSCTNTVIQPMSLAPWQLNCGIEGIYLVFLYPKVTFTSLTFTFHFR